VAPVAKLSRRTSARTHIRLIGRARGETARIYRWLGRHWQGFVINLSYFSFPLRNLLGARSGSNAAPVLGVAQLQEEPHDCRTDPAARVLRAADHH
jgi:hypothetical protein